MSFVMKRLFIFVCALGIFTALVPQMSQADISHGINPQIPFEGILRNEKGKLLQGSYDIVFHIYDVETGGEPVWTGRYTSANGNPVSIVDGYFRVMLGEGTDNAFEIDFSTDTYYIGMTVGTDSEMSPRERLGATPYAFNASLLDGYDSTDFLKNAGQLSLSDTLDTAILTIHQSGAGNFMDLYDEDGANLFSVEKSGRVIAASFQTNAGEDSVFDGNMIITDGSGIRFGNGNGVTIYQDMFGLGLSDLMFTPYGETSGSEAVNIITPNTLGLFANAGFDGTGVRAPSLELFKNGKAMLQNLAIGEEGDRFFEVAFSDGMEVTEGGFRVSDGGITVTDLGIMITSGSLRIGLGEAQEAVDVDGTIRSSALAGNGISDLATDDQGNIMVSSPSDERLKHNIHTIDDALDKVLGLRGVQYEWNDTERFGTQKEIGFVAQEVQEILPEIVRDNGEYLSLNSKNIVAVVVEAIKELYAETHDYFNRTEALEREVDILRNEIADLKGTSVPNELIEEEEPVNEVLENTESVVEETVLEEQIVEEVPVTE